MKIGATLVWTGLPILFAWFVGCNGRTTSDVATSAGSADAAKTFAGTFTRSGKTCGFVGTDIMIDGYYHGATARHCLDNLTCGDAAITLSGTHKMKCSAVENGRGTGNGDFVIVKFLGELPDSPFGVGLGTTALSGAEGVLVGPSGDEHACSHLTVQDSHISHQCETLANPSGYSGSPLFARVNGKYRLVAIHTAQVAKGIVPVASELPVERLRELAVTGIVGDTQSSRGAAENAWFNDCRNGYIRFLQTHPDYSGELGGISDRKELVAKAIPLIEEKAVELLEQYLNTMDFYFRPQCRGYGMQYEGLGLLRIDDQGICQKEPCPKLSPSPGPKGGMERAGVQSRDR